MKYRIKNLLIFILFISLIFLGAFAQPEMPENFTTYTYDGLFSISYPENWEPAISIIDSIKQKTDEYLKSIGDEGFSEEAQVVFMGGIPLGEEYYNPNLNITIIQSGSQKITLEMLEEFAENMNQQYKEELEEYNKISQITENIDGKQAILLEFEAQYPNFVSAHALQTFLFGGGFAWIITCSVVPPLNFNIYKDDIYTIPRSLKILSKPPEPEGFFGSINIGESLIKGLANGIILFIIFALYLVFKKIFSLFRRKT